MKKGDIEQLGEEAQKLAIELKVEGLTRSAIASRLNEEYDCDLSEQQVGCFFKRSQSKTFSIMKDEKDFDLKMARWHFDTMEQLKVLNREMWEFFLSIKSDPEFTTKQVFCPDCNHKFGVKVKTFMELIKAADHLLKQIEHQDKILGRMKEKGLTINYNFVDLSKKIQNVMPNLMHQAERQGDIRIIKKKKYKQKYN